MGLDIFFLEDIRNAIRAANEASYATAEVVSQDADDTLCALRDYRRGYRAALVTMALSFGLSPAIVEGGESGPSSRHIRADAEEG